MISRLSSFQKQENNLNGQEERAGGRAVFLAGEMQSVAVSSGSAASLLSFWKWSCFLSGQVGKDELGKEHRKELWKNERSERLAGDEGEKEKGKVLKKKGRLAGGEIQKSLFLLYFAPLAVSI